MNCTSRNSVFSGFTRSSCSISMDVRWLAVLPSFAVNTARVVTTTTSSVSIERIGVIGEFEFLLSIFLFCKFIKNYSYCIYFRSFY